MVHELGGWIWMLVPGADRETPDSELLNHKKNSRKAIPRILSGGRTESRAKVAISAVSTPMAKKLNALAASPSWTSVVARAIESVGLPSVIKITHGRK